MKRPRNWQAGDGSVSRKRYRFAPKQPTATQAARAIVAAAPGLVRLGGNFGRYGVNARQQGLKPELKFFDTTLSFNFDATAECSSDASTGGIALIPQGDTESTRDGRLAVIKSVQIRGRTFFAPAAAADATTVCYMYLILDTQANGAYPAITDVFTSNSPTAAMLNLNNSGRFRILKKWVMTHTAQAGVTTAYNNTIKPFEFYKRCNIPMDWSSTTGAITEIRSNNLLLAFGAANSDDLVSFSGTARLRFLG